MGSTKKEKKGGVVSATEFLDREIQLIVKTELLAYEAFKAIEITPTKQAIQKNLDVLKKAESLLPLILPAYAIEMGRHVSGLPFSEDEKGKLALNNLKTSHALEVLKERQKFFSNLHVRTGRPPSDIFMAGPARCADRLSALFKEKTGKYHWERVGEVVAEAFPKSLERGDGSDLRLWAFKLVKRRKTKLRNRKAIEQSLAPLAFGLAKKSP